MSADAIAIAKALENARQASAQLASYLALPVTHDRDKAGIIQAFEFTFEATWKLFQKIAVGEGGVATYAKQAIAAAFALKLIDGEALWLDMLDARNTTSHTYRREIADAIYSGVRDRFAGALAEAIERAAAFRSSTL